MALSDEDIREILRIIDESPLDELRIETDGFSLHVRRGAADGGAAGPDTAPVSASAQPAPAVAPADPGHAAAEPARPPAGPDDEIQDGALTIDAPMLGTFYRAESPGLSPFVEVGSRVEPDTTVCIIEVMKMMNSVAAGVAGTIVEVCSQDSELVEYGQPLFRLNPAA